MIKGSCLCGKVRFEVSKLAGPFELCHCNRCRKVSGSAFAAGVYAKTSALRFSTGLDVIKSFEAPVIERPPGYRTSFCTVCGSSVPDPSGSGDLVEIPAGCLDGNPELKPDKHIYVECKAPWYEIEDSLPRCRSAGPDDMLAL